MRIGKAGLDLIQHFEGLRLEPYNDQAGHATIGYGHLLHRGPVTDGDRKGFIKFSSAQAIDLLRGDTDFVSDWITHSCRVPLNQNQFDAVVCFVFNCGIGAVGSSKTWADLNAGHYQGFADNLLQWHHAGGKDSAGLANRRQAERALFCKLV